jgi:hypothetical protein
MPVSRSTSPTTEKPREWCAIRPRRLDRLPPDRVSPRTARPMAQVGKRVRPDVIFAEQLAGGTGWRHALAGEGSSAPAAGCSSFADVHREPLV